MHLATTEEAVGAEKWMHAAATEAKQARCLNAKCGAVIVIGEKIIGKGHNGPPKDDVTKRQCLAPRHYATKPNYDRTCCVHAEWRAILDALKNNAEKVAGATLYFARIGEDGVIFSGEPYCTVCSRLALDTGIATFVLQQHDGFAFYNTEEYNERSYETLRK